MEALTNQSLNTLNEFIKFEGGPKGIADELRDTCINLGILSAELLEAAAQGQKIDSPPGVSGSISAVQRLSELFYKLEMEWNEP